MTLVIPTHFEASDLPQLGWIHITDIGGENMYFEYRAKCGAYGKGYCKYLG